MRPELEFNQAKMRREIRRRQLLVQLRMRQTPIELNYALGKTKCLPLSYETPPAWALEAARLSWKESFAPLRAVLPSSDSRLTLDDVGALYGIYRSIVSYVSSPPEAVRQQESELPGLRALRNTAQKQVSLKFLKMLDKLSRKYSHGISLPTQEQLQSFDERYRRGFATFVPSAEDLPALKRTLTAKAYYLIWLFWPELRYRFSSPHIQEWLRKEHSLALADKTAQKIVTDLRKARLATSNPI